MAAIAAVVAVELLLRVMQIAPERSPMESDPFLHHVHPRHYQFQAMHVGREYGGFQLYFDREGRMAPVAHARAVPPPDDEDCRIALMGDSFVEAKQVVYERSLAGLLAEATHCTVRNYGVAGYSPSLELIQWRREVRAWRPTHVILLLCWNDLEDDANCLQGARLDDEGYPEAIPGPGGGDAGRFLRRLHVSRLLRATTLQAQFAMLTFVKNMDDVGGATDADPAFADPSARLVTRLHAEATAIGARFLLGVVPSRKMMNGLDTFTGGRMHATTRDWSRLNGIEFLDLESAFIAAIRAGRGSLYYRRDMHFTENGHRAAASAMAAAWPEVVRPVPVSR